MQLKLANWPPLLSHLLMIVFGMGLHNMLMPAPRQERVRLRPQRIYVVVPKKKQIYRKVKKKQPLAFAIKRPRQPRCALRARGARLQHRYQKTLLLNLTPKQATQIIYHLQQKSLEGVFSTDDPRGLELPQCALKANGCLRHALETGSGGVL